MFTAGDAGVHTFTNLTTLKTAGSQSVTATDTVTSTITGSAAVSVSPAAAMKLVFTQQPGNTKVNNAIKPAPVVKVEDAFSNVETGDNTDVVTMTIGTNPGGGTLSGTTSVTVSGGAATFNNLVINKAGNGYTLVASSGTLTSATSASFNITKGRAVAGQPGVHLDQLAAALAYEIKLQENGKQTNAFGGDDGDGGVGVAALLAVGKSPGVAEVDQLFAAVGSLSGSVQPAPLFETLGTLGVDV
jgi:hypothetical protein